jgi:RNA polymerase sigma-70 factor (sigma-E family)
MDDSFATFIAQRGAALYRYAYVVTGNAHDADDLVQEALVRLRGAWDRVTNRADPEGYVRTTMVRLHISIWRRRRRERLTTTLPDRGRVDAGIDRIDNDLGLWALVTALPPRQRAVLVLRYHDGLDDERIADLLHISRATVRSNAQRALAKLRARYRGGDGVTTASAGHPGDIKEGIVHA